MEVSWPSAAASMVDASNLGFLFAASAANAASLEYTVAALVFAAVLMGISHLALLIARRRHGLILHGFRQGFFVAAESVEELAVANRSPSSKPKASALRHSIDATPPRHDCLLAPSTTKPWDDSCGMITESAADFVGHTEVAELFDFFHNPLEARAYAFLSFVSIVTLLALSAETIMETFARYASLPDGVAPYHAVVAFFGLSFALREAAERLPMIIRVHRVVKCAIFVGAIAAIAQLAVADGGLALDPADPRRSPPPAPVGTTAPSWYLMVFAVTSLALEDHLSFTTYFVGAPAVKAAAGASVPQSLMKSPTFTPRVARRIVDGVVLTWGTKLVGVLTFVVGAYVAVPTFNTDAWPLTLHIASLTTPRVAVTARAAWFACAYGAVGVMLLSFAGDTSRAASLLYYSITGTRHAWNPRSAPAGVTVATVALVLGMLRDAQLSTVGSVYAVTRLFLSLVIPFVLLRCTRQSARRLGIPRRLDDALRLPPRLRRVCVTIGVAAVVFAIGASLGRFRDVVM